MFAVKKFGKRSWRECVRPTCNAVILESCLLSNSWIVRHRLFLRLWMIIIPMETSRPLRRSLVLGSFLP